MVKATAGRPSRENAEARLHRILAVAADEFVVNGFDRTTIDAIARKAGAAKRTIYQHFGSKENMLLEVFRVFGHEFNMRFKVIIDESRSPEEVLTDIGCYISEHFFEERQQRGLRLIVAEAGKVKGLSEISEESAREFRAPIIEYFKGLQQKGMFEFDDFDIAAKQFSNLCCLGYHFLVFSSQPLCDPETRRKIVDQAVKLFLAGYQKKAVADVVATVETSNETSQFRTLVGELRREREALSAERQALADLVCQLGCVKAD